MRSHNEFRLVIFQVHKLYEHLVKHKLIKDHRNHMTVLNEIALIVKAVDILIASQSTPVPTSNFATPDVVAALDALATKVKSGVSTDPDPTV